MFDLRPVRARRGTRRPHDPLTLIDILMEEDSGAETPPPATRTSIEISFVGLRARSEGKTGLAGLRALRREHPVLVRWLCTYLSVMAFVLALVLAVEAGK